MNPLAVWRNWRSRLDLIRSWELADTDVVLEVGSGQNPSPRADVLCERYVADGTERHDALPLVDRPFVVGDIDRLPFRDRAFDFVVCTHVLEHVADPVRAVAELMRVAPRGYVETPAAAWERMHSFPFHRWYVSEEGGRMVFRAKERPLHDPAARATLDRLFAGRPGLLDWLFRHERALGVVVGIVWEGRLEVEVHGTPAPETAEGFTGADAPDRAQEIAVLRRAATARPSSMGDRLYRRISRTLRRRSEPRVDLERQLVCPISGGDLRPADGAAGDGADGVLVSDAGHRYDVVRAGGREIPFLLP